MREGFPKKGILSFYWNPSLNIIRFSKREFRFPLLLANVLWDGDVNANAWQISASERLFLLKPLRVSVNHPAELLNYIIECVVV